MYDGKVRSDNKERSGFIGRTDNADLYTAVVNSPSLKRNIRVVYPVRTPGDKVAAACLFSADINLSATDIYRFYKARCQPEGSVPGRRTVGPDFLIVRPVAG